MEQVSSPQGTLPKHSTDMKITYNSSEFALSVSICFLNHLTKSAQCDVKSECITGTRNYSIIITEKSDLQVHKVWLSGTLRI